MTGRLIAFTGQAGSGKSTAASALLVHGWARVKFADPLKDMLRAFYRSVGLTEHRIYEKIEGSGKEQPCPYLADTTPRHAMQTLGTDWGRECLGDNVWVNAWHARVRLLLDQGKDVVADDCRFPNEAEAVRLLGGTVVRVRGRGGIGSDHASEKMDLVADITVTNDKSIRQFKDEIVYLLHRLDCPL